jgi:hypothetical protein
MKKRYSFDEKCLDLADYFYPEATKSQHDALAQQLQDCAEDFAQELADWKEDDGA